jgi:hypothetical protein
MNKVSNSNNLLYLSDYDTLLLELFFGDFSSFLFAFFENLSFNGTVGFLSVWGINKIR